MLDPSTQFCHNPDCPTSGKVGEGNIGVHSQEEGRYLCRVCGKTFAATRGTPFYRLHKAAELMVTLLCHGCPVQAIVAAFGLDERTVAGWQTKGGQHCQKAASISSGRGRWSWATSRPTGSGSRWWEGRSGWPWPSPSPLACGWGE